MTFELSGLEPYAVYRVSVAAATGAGTGNFSNLVQSRTFGDIPVAMVTLRTVNASCPAGILVEWEELMYNEAEFRGPEDAIMLVFNLSDGSTVQSVTVDYNSAATSVRLSGLDVFTNYSVRVGVANHNGTGPFSEEMYGVSCDGGKGERRERERE